MPRFSANISTMFREYAPLDRCRAAREAGFGCIEMQFPYDLDPDAFADAVRENGLAVSVINLPAGDFASGGEGTAAVPDRQDEFRAGVALGLRYARLLRAGAVNVLAGSPSPERGREACLDVLCANLRHAAAAFAGIGVPVVVEAINDVDRPDFLLPRAADVIAAIDRAGHANLALQFDLYHVGMMGEPVVETFKACRARIGHIQFADVPGRHEPGTGGLDFATAFSAIDAGGYRGWVAAEYTPSGRTEDGLGWFDPRAPAGGG